MVNGFIRVILLAAFACTLGLRLAHADVYTWVDAKGIVNVSNLPPPDGVRVTNVTHEIPQPPVPPRSDAAREAARQAEVQALSDRVRQLENEVELARRPAPPPPVEYAAPIVMQWAPVHYQIEMAPPSYASSGCDPSWWGCGAGWGSGYYYPSGVVVVRPPNFRHPHVGQPVRPAPVFSLPPMFGVSGRFRAG